MKTELYFMIRHTPFWAIPILLLSGEFAYLFWLRKKKTNVKICILFMLISITALSWYYYAGGPDKSVKKFMKWQRTFEL
ncbi:MAG: hypothetical protein K2P81_02365 [Bacteriovoracaceae bacterium]|nr:hypothetical protein [Bacteriovoracaceae bacterium]